MSSKTLRKNFTMPDYIVQKLEFLAQTMNKKQSAIISYLIEQESKKYEKEQKLKLANEMVGMFSGKIPEDLTIQSIKAQSEN